MQCAGISHLLLNLLVSCVILSPLRPTLIPDPPQSHRPNQQANRCCRWFTPRSRDFLTLFALPAVVEAGGLMDRWTVGEPSIFSSHFAGCLMTLPPSTHLCSLAPPSRPEARTSERVDETASPPPPPPPPSPLLLP